jgi:hypothetical protein
VVHMGTITAMLPETNWCWYITPFQCPAIVVHSKPTHTCVTDSGTGTVCNDRPQSVPHMCCSQHGTPPPKPQTQQHPYTPALSPHLLIP